MRGGLAVLIAAELLTLVPMNNPGVSEATKRCTVADLNGKRRAAVSSTYPGMFRLISFQTICPLGFDSRTGRERTPILQVRDFFAR
jgi:hypothetical protein